MNCVHIITPVKDSIELTLQTAKAIMESDIKTPFKYTIYNDFSSDKNTLILQQASQDMGFELVNLADITTTPSPNYLLVLHVAQKRAIAENAGLLIIESDVIVKKDTIQSLIDGADERPDCGFAASATVDENGDLNYPYLFAKGKENSVFAETKHCSFCCTLLSLDFLKSFDFEQLDPAKNWHDVTISRQSLKNGFKNYVFTNLDRKSVV